MLVHSCSPSTLELKQDDHEVIASLRNVVRYCDSRRELSAGECSAVGGVLA